MFGWISSLFGKIALGISGVLIGVAGFISPAQKEDALPAPSATSTSEIVPATPTSTVKKTSTPATKSVQVPPVQAVNPKPTQAVVPVSPSAKITPTIRSFDVSPTSASYGDDVTFSWSAQNAVSCAVPVADPSNLAIPFVGRLPQGSVSYKIVDTTGTSKSLTFWIVCADKDWATVSAKINIQLLEARVVGTPYTYNDGHGNRFVSVTVKGAASAHVSCVVATYNGTGAPNVVDSIVYPDNDTHITTAAIQENITAGLPLNCKINFSAGVEEEFSVQTPGR